MDSTAARNAFPEDKAPRYLAARNRTLFNSQA
jgi:hypothetical protein